MKKGEAWLVSTPWDETMSVNRFRINGIGVVSVRGVWETGSLKGREASLAKDLFNERKLEQLKEA
jgi:hypothetical protein